jgi:hypothetical protein
VELEAERIVEMMRISRKNGVITGVGNMNTAEVNSAVLDQYAVFVTQTQIKL